MSYKYCVVPQCKSTTKKCPEKLFFTVPSNEALRAKWCTMMNRKDIIKGKSKYICEDHFEVSCLQDFPSKYLVEYSLLRVIL